MVALAHWESKNIFITLHKGEAEKEVEHFTSRGTEHRRALLLKEIRFRIPLPFFAKQSYLVHASPQKYTRQRIFENQTVNRTRILFLYFLAPALTAALVTFPAFSLLGS